jgi:hypothetical protein
MITIASSEYGGIWTQTSAPIGNWFSIASDSTGMNLAAIQQPGYIFTSTSGFIINVISIIIDIIIATLGGSN